MLLTIVNSQEFGFFVRLMFCLLAGILIGAERESRGKAAGVSTQSFVIAGSMAFSFLSVLADPHSPARISAQIVSGVGFLGAGIILKSGEGRIVNLTTAASIWFSSSVGMLIGYGYYYLAILAVIYAMIVHKVPSVKPQSPVH